MSELVGKSLGRYQVISQLGKGGMATVYKAYDTSLERYVAIKVIRAEQVKDAEALERFKREAKSLAQLSHPNIVKVLDYGEYEGAPYLVMEFITGGALMLREGQAMGWAEAASLLAPIARALEYAHQRKIIHRDVKPANFLITESGMPMLSDFGIAKALEATDAQPLTATGVGIGTPDYMAPEQGMGKPVDARTDVYALGMVFYELVTGRKPFHADTPLAILLKQVHDPLPPPKSLNPELPDVIEQVLLKALAKSPDYRFQSMAEFANVLEKLGQGVQPAVKAISPDMETVVEKVVVEEKKPALAGEKKAKRAKPAVIVAISAVAVVVVCCLSLWLAYVFNICIPPGPWPNPPWCGVTIPEDHNRLVCPPPGDWPQPPWCQ